jgi:hypothetical protein
VSGYSGIVSIPDTEYFSAKALNVSTLKAFAKAPALGHVAKEETAAMRMGSLVHCAILEPSELENRYQPTDLERRGTKAWDAEELAAGGRELVKRRDYIEALRMRDAVWSNTHAREILDQCSTEIAAFWTDPETGLRCKAKADIWNRNLHVLCDIKTTCDASPRAFERDFAKMMYGYQDVFYRDGFTACFEEIEAFIFIAVEKTEPHLVKPYYLSPAQISSVRAEIRRLMERYADCAALNHWPGYGDDLHEIILPPWAFNEE